MLDPVLFPGESSLIGLQLVAELGAVDVAGWDTEVDMIIICGTTDGGY